MAEAENGTKCSSVPTPQSLLTSAESAIGVFTLRESGSNDALSNEGLSIDARNVLSVVSASAASYREESARIVIIEGARESGKTLLARMMKTVFSLDEEDVFYVSDGSDPMPRTFNAATYIYDNCELRDTDTLEADLHEIVARGHRAYLFVNDRTTLSTNVRHLARDVLRLYPGVICSLKDPNSRTCFLIRKLKDGDGYRPVEQSVSEQLRNETIRVGLIPDGPPGSSAFDRLFDYRLFSETPECL